MLERFVASSHQIRANRIRSGAWCVVKSAVKPIASRPAEFERIDGFGGLAVPTIAVGFSYGTLFGLVPVVMLEASHRQPDDL
jgi:hypothetical protein